MSNQDSKSGYGTSAEDDTKLPKVFSLMSNQDRNSGYGTSAEDDTKLSKVFSLMQTIPEVFFSLMVNKEEFDNGDPGVVEEGTDTVTILKEESNNGDAGDVEEGIDSTVTILKEESDNSDAGDVEGGTIDTDTILKFVFGWSTLLQEHIDSSQGLKAGGFFFMWLLNQGDLISDIILAGSMISNSEEDESPYGIFLLIMAIYTRCLSGLHTWWEAKNPASDDQQKYVRYMLMESTIFMVEDVATMLVLSQKSSDNMDALETTCTWLTIGRGVLCCLPFVHLGVTIMGGIVFCRFDVLGKILVGESKALKGVLFLVGYYVCPFWLSIFFCKQLALSDINEVHAGITEFVVYVWGVASASILIFLEPKFDMTYIKNNLNCFKICLS